MPNPNQRQALRALVRALYDFQRLRIASGHRTDHKKDGSTKKRATVIELEADDKAVIDGLSSDLGVLERKALRELSARVEADPVGAWITAHDGLGPIAAGVLLAEVDIVRCRTPSALWRFCGCDPTLPRPTRGEKSKYNRFLKTKLLGPVADAILKANIRATRPEKGDWIEKQREENEQSLSARLRADVREAPGLLERAEVDEKPAKSECAIKRDANGKKERAAGGETSERSERAAMGEASETRERLLVAYYVRRGSYAEVYADYRWRLWHRKGTCGPCKGTGAVMMEPTDIKKRAVGYESTVDRERDENPVTPDEPDRAVGGESPAMRKRCLNCLGTGIGPAGNSSAHRHRRALRYMIKMFLRDLWIKWRTEAGLEVKPDYATAKLGLNHAAMSEAPVLQER